MQASEWIILTKGFTQAMKAQYLGFSIKKIKALDRAARAGEELDSLPAGKVRAALIGIRPSSLSISNGKIIKVMEDQGARSKLFEIMTQRSAPMSLHERLSLRVQEFDAEKDCREKTQISSFNEWRIKAIAQAKTR